MKRCPKAVGKGAIHYGDVIMSVMGSQITSLTIVYSTVYSGADQRKYQSSTSLAFMRGIHRWLMNSPHKGPVTRKMFPFDDVIMFSSVGQNVSDHGSFGAICVRISIVVSCVCLEKQRQLQRIFYYNDNKYKLYTSHKTTVINIKSAHLPLAYTVKTFILLTRLVKILTLPSL